MYIQALLNLLPLAHGIVSPGAAENRDGVLDRLGNLTPYHKAPAVEGIKKQLPGDCSVDQVMLTHRHGSRGPLQSELSLIQGLTYTLGNASQAIEHANLPVNLQFLKQGYVTKLKPESLSPIGRKQLFDHGVDFLLRYPRLHTDTFVAGNEERVIESSHWFGQGYLGGNASGAHFITIPDDVSKASWIRPWIACPAWGKGWNVKARATWVKTYLPSITKRLNKLLPGVHLSDDDTHGALFACAYDLAAYGVSPWCDVFSPTELSYFEYELDVMINGGFGYNLIPPEMGPVMGSVYVNTLIERFSNATGDATPLYLEFGHDGTIYTAMTAMGLAKDEPPLCPNGINPFRKWRTSYQVPFAANMVWERFTCTDSFRGPQIRLVLNEETFPLSICAKTKSDKTYGTCSLVEFITANKFSTDIQFGDATWSAAC
ncbi:phosphoglycerate mutase-like protein, partial [Leucogyrophana mollusca]